MAFTYSNILRSIFRGRYISKLQYFGEIEKTNVGIANLVINVAENIVPIIAYYDTEKYFIEKKYHNKTILFPLVLSALKRGVKSCNTIMEEVFRNTGAVLSKILFKDDFYYIGRGIILDKNFNLMMLVCSKISTNTSSNESYIYINSTLYNNTDSLSKYIVSTFLKNVGKTLNTLSISLDVNSKITVIIKNINNYMSRNINVAYTEYNQDSINKLLNDNVNRIFKNLK